MLTDASAVDPRGECSQIMLPTWPSVGLRLYEQISWIVDPSFAIFLLGVVTSIAEIVSQSS